MGRPSQKSGGEGGGIGLVHDQNRGKVYKTAGSGSCHFRKGQAGKGWGTKKECSTPQSINTEGPSVRKLNKRFVHSFIF